MTSPSVRSGKWIALSVAAVALHMLPPLIFMVRLMPASRMGSLGDFSAYYFALQEAISGGNPYDVTKLRALTTIHVPPYVYPPPFLLAMLWSLLLTPKAAFMAMFVLNELLLAAVLWLMRRHLGLGWKQMLLLLATFFPLWDNLSWGQVNLLLLLPALGAIVLVERRPNLAGALVGVAAVTKVIPALLVLYWMLRREWRPVAAALAAALALSVLSLPLVGADLQISYYAQTLLGHAQGHLVQLGLKVPIASEYNHSLVGVFSHVWPGPDRFQPSRMAQGMALSVLVVLLVQWARGFRQGCTPAAALASLLGLASIASTYAWEHHLVLLLPAAVLAARSGAPRWLRTGLYACMIWPLGMLNISAMVFPPLRGVIPVITPLIATSKLLGVVGLCVLCLRVPVPEPRPAAGAVPSPAV